YEEETNLRCHVLLDTSSSMYYPQPDFGKMTFSVMAAASITYLLQKQKDAVSLCTFSDKIEVQTQVKSTPSHVHKIMLELNNLLQSNKPLHRTSVADVLHEIAEKIHKRSLVVIFSDMFDNPDEAEPIFSALQHLRHNLHEVLLFHVTDKKTEENFDFENRPYEFIDLESGEKVKVQPEQVRESYRQSVSEFYRKLKLKCGQYKIDFIDADIAQGFDPILTAYLVKHSKMR
ncbi:MAG TPA: VWA domain-containing protein, partial [Dyadobacter sp.]|nr:VWA domain-containing protein [Dyadobacter sp.]